MKVKEATETGKIDGLPEYALHKIIYHLQTQNDNVNFLLSDGYISINLLCRNLKMRMYLVKVSISSLMHTLSNPTLKSLSEKA